MTMYTSTRPVVPRGDLASGVKTFRRISLSGHLVTGVHIAWHDATADYNSTSKFYYSCLDDPTVPDDDATPALDQWVEDTTIAFTGAAGSAAGSEIIHTGNNGAKYMLWEVTPSATSPTTVWSHGKA